MRDELLIIFAEFCFKHSLKEGKLIWPAVDFFFTVVFINLLFLDKIRAIMTSIVTYLNCTLDEFMSVHLVDLLSCWLAKTHAVSEYVIFLNIMYEMTADPFALFT
jgi:hypothetical protein